MKKTNSCNAIIFFCAIAAENNIRKSKNGNFYFIFFYMQYVRFPAQHDLCVCMCVRAVVLLYSLEVTLHQSICCRCIKIQLLITYNSSVRVYRYSEWTCLPHNILRINPKNRKNDNGQHFLLWVANSCASRSHIPKYESKILVTELKKKKKT